MATQLENLATLDWPAAAALVKEGLSAGLLRKLADQLRLGLEDLAAPLNLTGRTLHRRLEEGRLSLDESERLFALNKIVAKATEVLGSEEKAIHWLKSPVPALGGRTPLACAETQIGLREVEDVLTRIEDVAYS
jgi:putative toxin-antitoxin system antitoxin component (TIGR02293 family)